MRSGPAVAEALSPAPIGVSRVLSLAWPVLVGQLAVLAFGTIDTALVAQSGSGHLAALAVGMSAYITIFIGLMGTLLAISPIVGQLFGGKNLVGAGAQVQQAAWLALVLAIPGSSLLLWPEPFLKLAQLQGPEAESARAYLAALAISLPASLMFTVFRGFNTAVSRPKPVMLLNMLGLAVKLPLSWLAIRGWPEMGWSPVGVSGCGWATAAAMWTQATVAWLMFWRDPFYRPFQIWQGGLARPAWTTLGPMLRLGLPMGLTILAEVAGFSFMALFISRLGSMQVAAHQIVVNLVSVMFMLPMALANATTTLVAQEVGAGRLCEARRVGWLGLRTALMASVGLGLAIHLGRTQVMALYTTDPELTALALSLLGWVVIFHIADALQVMCAFILRAWKVATVPALVYMAGLGGVGLIGGNVLGFNLTGQVPLGWQGARGFWMACTSGLILVAIALLGVLLWVLREQFPSEPVISSNESVG